MIKVILLFAYDMLNLSLMTPDQANSWNLFRGKSCKRKMESDIRIKSSFPTRLVFGTILLLSYVSLDIKYPYSVLFPSVLASSLGPFRVAPNRRITPFYKLVTTISRGGSSDEEEGPVEENSKEGSEGEAGESDNNLYDDEQNEDLQTQQRESKHNPMASFAAPFRMNEATKEEALKSSTSSSTSSDSSSSDGEDEQSDENETKNNKKNLSGTSVGTSGATMVKAKPPRRNKVMSALDTSRVAPLSSRLMDENSANGDVPLEEDEDTELSPDEEESDDMEETEEDMEKSSESSSSREMTEMAKLWWVNVRQIYLSEIDGDEDDVESDEFIVSNETSSSTEENRRSERNETTTDDESASSSSVEQDKATEMDGSLGESNALEEANVEILESANPEDSPVPPDSVLEESNTGFAESHPYVSSGVVSILVSKCWPKNSSLVCLSSRVLFLTLFHVYVLVVLAGQCFDSRTCVTESILAIVSWVTRYPKSLRESYWTSRLIKWETPRILDDPHCGQRSRRTDCWC